MTAKKAFSRFYKTPVNVYGIKRGSSYSAPVQTELLCCIRADIQPCGGGLEREEYGFSVKRKFKLYCQDCNEICEGGYVGFDGGMYLVISAEKWETGITAMIEEV